MQVAQILKVTSYFFANWFNKLGGVHQHLKVDLYHKTAQLKVGFVSKQSDRL